MLERSRLRLRSLVALALLNCVLTPRGLAVDAKPANISTNSWTLPEESSRVFYRFFRDKISWFEADAVCQFHHGSLVTVNNGVQFDATRAFLRELDIAETVWIGLKGASSAAQFFWADGTPLDFNAGYWAESFPATESPLCAAIDPSREFRWHALNCNGPATSAFLCELPVPDWGSRCTVTAMPSVSIQYLSDAAAIRLSRDCGDEEGERHVLCTATTDRAAVLAQLACSSSSNNNNQANIASTSPAPSAAPSSTTESSVASAINKIVTEFQSIATNESLTAELEPVKPRKWQGKKYSSAAEKKSKRVQKEKEETQQQQKEEVDESPLLSTSTNEPERLPRVKKMRAEDLKEAPVREERVRRETQNVPVPTTDSSSSAGAAETSPLSAVDSAATSTSTEESGAANSTTWDTDGGVLFGNATTEAELGSGFWTVTNHSDDSTTTTTTTDVETEAATVKAATATAASSDVTKEPNEEMRRSNARIPLEHPGGFVPPMLMVKSKFVQQLKQQQEKEQQQLTQEKDEEERRGSHLNEVDGPVAQGESPNDISKFYPASTERPKEAQEVLIKVQELPNNASETTVQLLSSATEASREKTTTAATVETKEEEETAPTETSPSHSSSSSAVAETSTSSDPPVTVTVTGTTLAAASSAESSAAPATEGGETKEPVQNYHSEFSFNNAENYKPYRPNRRRMLTKSPSHSYLRKILG